MTIPKWDIFFVGCPKWKVVDRHEEKFRLKNARLGCDKYVETGRKNGAICLKNGPGTI